MESVPRGGCAARCGGRGLLITLRVRPCPCWTPKSKLSARARCLQKGPCPRSSICSAPGGVVQRAVTRGFLNKAPLTNPLLATLLTGPTLANSTRNTNTHMFPCPPTPTLCHVWHDLDTCRCGPAGNASQARECIRNACNIRGRSIVGHMSTTRQSHCTTYAEAEDESTKYRRPPTTGTSNRASSTI